MVKKAATFLNKCDDLLFSIISHGRDLNETIEVKKAKEDDVLDEDDVQRDTELERDWRVFCGACSDDRQAREEWRIEVRQVIEAESTSHLTTLASKFCVLHLSFWEIVARHVGAIEDRLKNAIRLLSSSSCLQENQHPKPPPGPQNNLSPSENSFSSENNPTPMVVGGLLQEGQGTTTTNTGLSAAQEKNALMSPRNIFLPSLSTPRIVWARVRGYPWWPGREHKPTSSFLASELARRQLHLVLFFGEAVQYVVPSSNLADFTGEPDDPYMPKPGKGGSSKSLFDVIRRAKLALNQQVAPSSAAANFLSDNGKQGPPILKNCQIPAAEDDDDDDDDLICLPKKRAIVEV